MVTRAEKIAAHKAKMQGSTKPDASGSTKRAELPKAKTRAEKIAAHKAKMQGADAKHDG